MSWQVLIAAVGVMVRAGGYSLCRSARDDAADGSLAVGLAAGRGSQRRHLVCDTGPDPVLLRGAVWMTRCVLPANGHSSEITRMRV